MKKLFIVLLTTICTMNLSAQDKYSFTAKVGSAMSMNMPSITPFTIEAMAHYNLTSHWAFGAGTGFGQFDNVSTVPLYANAKYTINPEAKYNLFADCSIGHSFTLGSGKNGGFYLNPEFGVQRKLWGKIFTFGIGYQLQEMERLKNNSDNFVSSQFIESLSSHGVSIKLGVIF